jgi:hypothetical protein
LIEIAGGGGLGGVRVEVPGRSSGAAKCQPLEFRDRSAVVLLFALFASILRCGRLHICYFCIRVHRELLMGSISSEHEHRSLYVPAELPPRLAPSRQTPRWRSKGSRREQCISGVYRGEMDV